MKIVCKACRAVYQVDPSKIPEAGASFRCKRCSRIIRIAAPGSAAEGIPGTDRTKASAHRSASADLREQAGAIDQTGSGSKGKERNMGPKPPGGAAGTGGNANFSLRRGENQSDSKLKLIMTALVIALLLCIHIQPVRGLLFENFLFRAADRSAEEYIDEAFKRATIAYGAARAINAVISLLQASNLEFHPAGVGVTVAVGEILDPVNDIVERFSWIMLVSLLSLGIQKSMVVIGPWLSVSVLLTISLACVLLSMWLKNGASRSFQTIAKKALLAALVLKFAMPCVASLNHRVYSNILENQYESASENIQAQADHLKDLELQENPNGSGNQVEGQSNGWWDKTKHMVSNASEALKNVSSVKEKIAGLKDKAGEITESLIRLSIVFMLNTIVIPVLFLWGLVHFARLLIGTSFGSRLENRVRERIFAGTRRDSFDSDRAGAEAGA